MRPPRVRRSAGGPSAPPPPGAAPPPRTRHPALARPVARAGGRASPVLVADRPPLAPAEDDRGVDQRDPLQRRLLEGVEEGAHPADDQPPGVGFALHPPADLLDHLRLDLAVDGPKEIPLVAEVVVESAARDLG